VQRAVFLEKEGGGDCAGDGSSRPGSRPWSGQSAGGSSAGLLSSAQTPQPQDVRMGAAATVAAGGAKTWIGSAMRPGSASMLRPPTSGRPMAVRPASAHAAGHGARQGVTPDLPHVFLPVHSADPALKAYSDDAAPRAFDHESGAPTLDDESKKWLSPPPLRSTGGGGEVHVRGSLTGVVDDQESESSYSDSGSDSPLLSRASDTATDSSSFDGFKPPTPPLAAAGSKDEKGPRNMQPPPVLFQPSGTGGGGWGGKGGGGGLEKPSGLPKLDLSGMGSNLGMGLPKLGAAGNTLPLINPEPLGAPRGSALGEQLPHERESLGAPSVERPERPPAPAHGRAGKASPRAGASVELEETPPVSVQRADRGVPAGRGVGGVENESVSQSGQCQGSKEKESPSMVLESPSIVLESPSKGRKHASAISHMYSSSSSGLPAKSPSPGSEGMVGSDPSMSDKEYGEDEDFVQEDGDAIDDFEMAVDEAISARRSGGARSTSAKGGPI